MRLVIVVLLALALIGTLAYLYNRRTQKQENAVATFSIREINNRYTACLKQPSDANAGCLKSTEEMRQYMKVHNATAAETAKATIAAAMKDHGSNS